MNWSTSWTSSPISSPGFNAITTSWLWTPVNSTCRKYSFSLATSLSSIRRASITTPPQPNSRSSQPPERGLEHGRRSHRIVPEVPETVDDVDDPVEVTRRANQDRNVTLAINLAREGDDVGANVDTDSAGRGRHQGRHEGAGDLVSQLVVGPKEHLEQVAAADDPGDTAPLVNHHQAPDVLLLHHLSGLAQRGVGRDRDRR